MTDLASPELSRRATISVVVPVYCEVENVRVFHDSLFAAIGDVDYDVELIFVDDGSTDGTYEELCKLSDEDSRVRILRLSRNFGAHAAISAGLRLANGDAVAIISVDGQDPPEIIPQFVEKWREGYSVVWGFRDGRADPATKRLLAASFHWLFRRIALADVPPGGMDTGLFDRRVVDVYAEIKDDSIVPAYAIFSLGFDGTSISYRRRERRAGTSGWPFWKRLRNAIDLITSFSYVPIRLISLVGLLGSLLAILLAAIVIYQRLVLGMGESGWPSLAVLILFVSSVQMLMLGIIAEYIWRTSRQVRGYPRYVVVEDRRIGTSDPQAARNSGRRTELKPAGPYQSPE